MFPAPLVAPGVVDYQLTLIFAEVDVGVVDVLSLGDLLALPVSESGIGDFFVFVGELQDGIQWTWLPVDEVPRAHDSLVINRAFMSFEVKIIEPAIKIS